MFKESLATGLLLIYYGYLYNRTVLGDQLCSVRWEIDVTQ